MNTHIPTEGDSPSVIHAERVLAIQGRAFDALQRVRAAAWDAGSKGNSSHAAEDNEENIAHEVTAAVVELVTLALGIETAA